MTKGLTAQKLSIKLRSHVERVSGVTAGEWINTGLDGGTEFSFITNSWDGRELLVTVNELKPPKGSDK